MDIPTANQVPTTCLLNHHNSSSHHLIVPIIAIQVIPLDCPNTAHQVIPLDCTTLTSQSLTLWPSPHANYEGFDHALISASERLSWQVTMGPLHKPVLNTIQVRENKTAECRYTTAHPVDLLRGTTITPQHSPHYADKYQASYTTQHGTLPVTQIPKSWTTVLTICSS
jgi:hypothetical protein